MTRQLMSFPAIAFHHSALALLLTLPTLTGCHSSSSSSSAAPAVTNSGGSSPGTPNAGVPELGPLISGEMALIEGRYIWTDYAYDDRGSNNNSVPGGDATYPDPPHPGNTADLIQLQIDTDSQGALRINVILQTLVPGQEVLAGIGFDTDANTTTGAPGLPGGGWMNSGDLGLEELLLLYSNGVGKQLQFLDGEWVEVGSFAVSADRTRNVVSATIAGLKPGSSQWNAVAALSPADGNDGWFDGSADIFDLAFVRGEDPVQDPAFALPEQVPQIQRPWQDKNQADILAGLAASSGAVANIQFGGTATSLPATVPGLHTFLYHSALTLEEGVRADPLQYRGLYQPYVVMIPDGLPAKPPAVIFMHGSDQNHAVNAVHFSPNGIVIPGFYTVPAVVVFPMGRDPTWGTGLSEQDLLDSTDDAINRLNLDANRLVLSGISAGGIGTFRHAARHPDKWTGGYSIVGGGTTHLGNLRNLPLRAHNGLLDPLVDVTFWQASADALAATNGVDYRTALVHTSSHLPSPLGNCWYLEMLAEPRQLDPARVSYTVDPAGFFVDAAANLDIRPRSAYWVLELVSRNDKPASIDAISLARSDRLYNATDIDRYGSSLTGADFCGANPDNIGPDVWQELGRQQTLGAPQTVENGMQLILNGLASAQLDTRRMSLSSSKALVIESNSDGLTELILLGNWASPPQLLLDDVTQAAPTFSNNTVRFTVATGEHRYELR
ncbi:MAG: hypothetical protein ACI9G5_001851 [Paracoccaceae bacterium]|jgi:hypothetical protein